MKKIYSIIFATLISFNQILSVQIIDNPRKNLEKNVNDKNLTKIMKNSLIETNSVKILIFFKNL